MPLVSIIAFPEQRTACLTSWKALSRAQVTVYYVRAVARNIMNRATCLRLPSILVCEQSAPRASQEQVCGAIT